MVVMRWQDVYAKFGSDRQSGFGLHDSPNKYLNPPNVTNHARTMKRYGIDNYKILADADNKKAGRVQIYRQHGIHSIVRTHVDRPTPNFVIDLQVARDYVNAGAWAIEPMNEPNLRDEWKDGTFPSSWVEYGKIVARQWMRNADVILSAGGVPVTPALSPGGHVPHREATLRFLDGINFHGGRAQLDRAVIGVHWRPLNNPIDTPPGTGNPPNTTLWRENEWFFATYSQFLGYMPGFVETESGYSPGSSENGTFPPMTLATWASFNQELYSRLSPAHPKATPGQVICQDYWIEGTDGSGVWRIDAAFINWLEDNQPPDEPLWGKAIRTMGINWDRKVLVSGGTTPPPPDNPPPGNPVPPSSNAINLPEWCSVIRATVPAGQQYYKLNSARWQDDTQSGGLHHIFVEQPHDPTKSFNVSNGQQNWNVPLDKPASEPAGNFAMFGGNVYTAKMNGLPSDSVAGMKMPSNHHVNYFLEYKLETMPTTEPPPLPPTESLETVMLRAGATVATVPITPGQALFDAIIRDALIPNGLEAYASHGGKNYVVRHAEHVSNGGAYVYYAEIGHWGNIRRLVRRPPVVVPPAPPPLPAPSPVINHERQSPNFDERPANHKPLVLQLHHTGGGLVSSLNHLCNDRVPLKDRVSSHYVVGKEGQTYQLVDESKRAWHSGPGIHKGREDPNDFTISIEIVNAGDGKDPFPKVQLDAVVALSKDIVRRNSIIRSDVTDHKATRAAYKAKYPNVPKVFHKSDMAANFPLQETITRIYE